MVNYRCIKIQLNSELSSLIISFIIFYILLFLFIYFGYKRNCSGCQAQHLFLIVCFFSTYNSNSVFSFFWKTKALLPNAF